MKRLLFAVMVSLMFTPALFATAGTPWNQDYPCPDLDCSGASATGWADGMLSCTVKGSQGGRCVTCAEDIETQKPVCVRLQGSYSCKCEIKYSNGGVRKCSATVYCQYMN
jgi:hypothetical protein